jgi:hypothetical protein
MGGRGVEEQPAMMAATLVAANRAWRRWMEWFTVVSDADSFWF